MNDIEKAIQAFLLPLPIFTLRMSTWSNSYSLEPVDWPDQPGTNDPIQGLVNAVALEYFDIHTHQYSVNREQTIARVHDAIYKRLLEFLERHLKNKHPTQTKLYRFCRFDLFTLVRSNTNIENAVVALYRFIRLNDETLDHKQIEACIAALTMLMDKHSKDK